MNLVLIGYRGTGKTTLSDLLHDTLVMPVYHCDEMLEERFEMRIAEFVKRYGWEEFRIEEEILIDELCQHDGIIIDTGGGAVTREINRKRLKECGFVVWLQSSIESITRYIQKDKNRPSLTQTKSSVEEIEELLEERKPLYEATADFVVRTDSMPLEQCAELTIQEWKKRNETVETE